MVTKEVEDAGGNPLVPSGTGGDLRKLTLAEKRQLKRDLAMLTDAVKQYPARMKPEILRDMADLGWQLAKDAESDPRTKVTALKYLQALLSLNVKLALSVYDKQKKAEGEGPASGGTCIKVYNNINILNV
jgi:hypothetical protein